MGMAGLSLCFSKESAVVYAIFCDSVTQKQAQNPKDWK